MSSQHTTSPSALSTKIMLVLLAGIFAVSSAAIFIRFAQNEAPSLVISAWRMSIAAVIMGGVVLFRHRAEISRVKGRQLGPIILTGVILALHFASWVTSLELTSVASSVVLVTTTPLWVALASPFVLKERIGSGVWLGLGIALVGGLVVGASEACVFDNYQIICQSAGDVFAGKALLGDLLALVGAWCAAAYMIAGRKLRTNLSLAPYTFIVYGSSALTLLVWATLSGQNLFGNITPNGIQPFGLETWLWFIALGLVPQLIGHSVFNWALKYLKAAFVSVALLGEPVGAVILALIFLKETPTSLELAGGLLILFGIYLVSRVKQSEAPQTA